jgi:hypothetical protein
MWDPFKESLLMDYHYGCSNGLGKILLATWEGTSKLNLEAGVIFSKNMYTKAYQVLRMI